MDPVRSRPDGHGRSDGVLRNRNVPEVPRRVPVSLRRVPPGRRLDGQKFKDAVAHVPAVAHRGLESEIETSTALVDAPKTMAVPGRCALSATGANVTAFDRHPCSGRRSWARRYSTTTIRRSRPRARSHRFAQRRMRMGEPRRMTKMDLAHRIGRRPRPAETVHRRRVSREERRRDYRLAGVERRYVLQSLNNLDRSGLDLGVVASVVTRRKGFLPPSATRAEGHLS
jgi:hypothetical protein